MLTIEDINNLARLARIELSTEEKIKLQKDMESILNYVGQLSQVSTEALPMGLADVAGEPIGKASVLVNVMREDAVTTETGEYKDAILANAPKREGDYFSVKAIFEDR